MTSTDRLRILGGLTLLFGLSLVAACDATVRSVAQDRGGYSPTELRYATDNKDLLVEITGNPFAVDRAVLEGMVEDAMQPSHWGVDQAFTPRTHPTMKPGPSARLDYRISVSFSGPALEAPALMCAGSQAGEAAVPSEPIRARMAFCHEGQMLSTSYGTLEAADGPDDKRFLGLVSRLTRELFPERNFHDGGRSKVRRTA